MHFQWPVKDEANLGVMAPGKTAVIERDIDLNDVIDGDLVLVDDAGRWPEPRIRMLRKGVDGSVYV